MPVRSKPAFHLEGHYDQLRRGVFAVVALGFERVVWEAQADEKAISHLPEAA